MLLHTNTDTHLNRFSCLIFSRSEPPLGWDGGAEKYSQVTGKQGFCAGQQNISCGFHPRCPTMQGKPTAVEFQTTEAYQEGEGARNVLIPNR